MCCFVYFSDFNVLFFEKKLKTCYSLLLKKNNLSRGKIPAPPPLDIKWSITKLNIISLSGQLNVNIVLFTGSCFSNLVNENRAAVTERLVRIPSCAYHGQNPECGIAVFNCCQGN